MRKNIKLLEISFATVILCVALFGILCMRKRDFSNSDKDIVQISLIGKLYAYPEKSLFMVPATESARKFQETNDENEEIRKQKYREAQPGMEIVSAYFVVPQKITTFYPLTITIFYNRRPTQGELGVYLKKFMESPANKHLLSDPIFIREIALYHPFDDKKGFKSLMFHMNDICAPRMTESGQYSSENYASLTSGLAFDYYNLKKNYCVRVVHATYLRDKDGSGTDLVAIPEAPKYFKDWKDGIYFPNDPADKHQRPNLREVLPIIAKSVMENIEETGLIEKFLAEKAAAKSQKTSGFPIPLRGTSGSPVRLDATHVNAASAGCQPRWHGRREKVAWAARPCVCGAPHCDSLGRPSAAWERRRPSYWENERVGMGMKVRGCGYWGVWCVGIGHVANAWASRPCHFSAAAAAPSAAPFAAETRAGRSCHFFLRTLKGVCIQGISERTQRPLRRAPSFLVFH